MNFVIRVATKDDAKDVHDIYGAYVDGEHVTFTEINSSIEEYEEKIEHTLKKYPFYIAEDDNHNVLGYVYGSPLRPHDAYRWNVESTIVLSPDAPRRAGIATALYEKFEESLATLGYRYIYAVIVDTNEASIALHASLGYQEVGHFHNAGFKMGKWKGIVWMAKSIGDEDASPEEPKPYITCQHVL